MFGRMTLSTLKCAENIGVEEVVAHVVSPRQCEFREISGIRGGRDPEGKRRREGEREKDGSA